MATQQNFNIEDNRVFEVLEQHDNGFRHVTLMEVSQDYFGERYNTRWLVFTGGSRYGVMRSFNSLEHALEYYWKQIGKKGGKDA